MRGGCVAGGGAPRKRSQPYQAAINVDDAAFNNERREKTSESDTAITSNKEQL